MKIKILAIFLAFSVIALSILIGVYVEKDENSSTTLIENGNIIHLNSREDIYIHLIDRYKDHLQEECDTIELKIVNDILESRFDLP